MELVVDPARARDFEKIRNLDSSFFRTWILHLV